MDFESPDVAKEFPGLYASDKQVHQGQLDLDCDFSDEGHEKPSKKDLLIGKRKDKKESKKDKGYIAFEGESSGDEVDAGEQKSPTKGSRKSRSAFKFSKRDKPKEKSKEKREDHHKEKVKERKDEKEKKKESKVKLKLKDRKKSKYGDEESFDKDDRPVFGVPLAVAVERSKCHDGIELPAIVRECIDYIEEHGLSCEGIYRLSGVKSKVQKLRSQYNRGEQVCLFEHEPHIVASLLKLFLREIPDPILTNELMPKFEETSALKNEPKKSDGLKRLISELPLCNRLLVSWIFVHMQHIIQREKVNKMNVQNVSIVLSPTMQISHRVLNAMFAHIGTLFRDVVLKKYVPPLKPETSRLSLELPDTPTAIQDEIVKQESLLAQLHAEMFSGLADREKEEQLWEVQRVVTQLKRKLRFAKRALEVEKSEADAARVTLGGGGGGDEEVIDPTLNDVPLDMRLADASAHQHTVTVEHKCTVYVPWQSVAKEQDTVVDSKADSIQQHQVDGVTEVEIVSSSSEYKDETSLKPLTISKQDGDVVSDGEDGWSECKLVEDAAPITTTVDVGVSTLTSNEIEELILEECSVLIHQEELSQLADELQRKIEAERLEVEKLKCKIGELQTLYRYRNLSYNNSDDNSSNDDDCTDSEAEDFDDVVYNEEESLLRTLNQLEANNQQLEKENSELIDRIERERVASLDVKVQIRLFQSRLPRFQPLVV